MLRMQDHQDLQVVKELIVLLQNLDLEKRKVGLSIKLLEEIEKKEALEKYGF